MPAHPKPSQKEGAKPKKPSSFRTSPKTSSKLKTPRSVKDYPPRVPASASLARRFMAPLETTLNDLPKGQTKGDLILSMLAKGATSAELEAATGWKPHSVRGYLGTLRKRNVPVISDKVKGSRTVYRIETAEVL